MDETTVTKPALLHLANDLRRDAAFFVPCGIACGLIQLVGYRYFDHADWGTTLVSEHIALITLGALALGLLGMWMVYQRRWPTPRHPTGLMVAMRHGAERAQGLASTGACICVGFTLVAAFSGGGYRLVMFVYFILYLIAFGEMAANSWHYRPASQSLGWLVGIVIAAPLVGMLMR